MAVSATSLRILELSTKTKLKWIKKHYREQLMYVEAGTEESKRIVELLDAVDAELEKR